GTDDEKSQEDREFLFVGLRRHQRSRCTLSIKTCHGPPLRSRLKCFSRCHLTLADDFCASGARHAIDLAAYVLTDWPVMQALNPKNAQSYFVTDGQTDIAACFDRTTSQVKAALKFDWKANSHDVSRAWQDGGVLKISKIYPDPATGK